MDRSCLPGADKIFGRDTPERLRSQAGWNCIVMDRKSCLRPLLRVVDSQESQPGSHAALLLFSEGS